jgi:hypothetical protein
MLLNKKKIQSIKLETNGRLFPLWIMNNFKKYILPPIINLDDPCKDIDNKELGNNLTLYQEFIGQYLHYESFYKDILIYHGVGSGSARTALNIYNILYNYTPNWNVFILIPAALYNDPWMKEIKEYLKTNNNISNIIFIYYDSNTADTDFFTKIKSIDTNNKSIFIIDEIHKFISNVYNNMYSNRGHQAQMIYDYIQNEKRDNKDTRIILLSPTPMINKPFEFILIFNLLRPGIFPTSEYTFEQLFILNNNKNMFQRRIIGLVSYYIGSIDKYAKKIVKYVNITMSSYQEEIYNNLLKNENKKKIKLNNTIYTSYTRKACNFVFLNDNIKLLENKENKLKNKDNNLNILNKYINKIIENDKENNHTLLDDINKINNEYNNFITTYLKSSNVKSKLLLELYNLSPKFIRIIFNIKKTKGIVLVYSNYITGEGLEMFKYYLKLFNYINIDDDTELNKNKLEQDLTYDYYRYCEYNETINKDEREINKNIFNLSDNKYGKYCKIILLSKTDIESFKLYNIRQIHIIEPNLNEIIIEKIINSIINICHHKDLPVNERIVEIYKYIMIHSKNILTTDQIIDKIAKDKYNILLSFINIVKEVAIDCELFKNHNMINYKYKCFNFNQDTLFDSIIGPAYKLNIDTDSKLNNGLNDINSKILRIKVRKIKAVIKISEDIYSEEKYYLYHDKTNIVYDLDLHFPIGKLDKDENNKNKLLDNNLYIIVNVINVPKNINYV